jgi:hypothetical protein
MADRWLDRNVQAWSDAHGHVPMWATAGNGVPIRHHDSSAIDVLPPGAPVAVVIGTELLVPLRARHTGWPHRIVVIEPRPAVARTVMSTHDWTDWLRERRLVVLVGPDYAGAAQVARDVSGLSNAPVAVSPALPADAAERGRRALAELTFGQGANEGARKASAGRYLLQTLANASRLSREAPVDLLTDIFQGRPAIVVAAGPSLDRNVHDLAPVLDRAVVIACDTAARPLINLGVEPDFIVATDGSRANAAHLSSLPSSRSWLVAEGGLHPSAFVHSDGRTFFFRVANHEPWPWLRGVGLDCGVLGTWGSVATSAFSLALSLGCSPIVFAGADFAFTDGRPYCRGTSFEPLWASWIAGGSSYDAIWRHLVDRWPPMSAPDLRGRVTRTAAHLVSFRNWILERAGALPDRMIVNATDAGLLVGPGIAQQSAVATLADAPVLNREAAHQIIRGAHRRARRDQLRLLAATTDLLTRESPAELPAWTAFSGGTVSRDAIHAALNSPEQAAWTAALTAMQSLATSTA